VLRYTAILKIVRITDPIRPLYCETEACIVVGCLRDGNRIAGLQPDKSRNLQAGQFPQPWNVVSPPEREHVRDVTAGDIFLQMTVIRIGCAGAVQYRSCEDCLRKDTGRVVDEFGKRVRRIQRQTVRQTLLQLYGAGVVIRVSDIVPEQRDRREARKWPQ